MFATHHSREEADAVEGAEGEAAEESGNRLDTTRKETKRTRKMAKKIIIKNK